MNSDTEAITKQIEEIIKERTNKTDKDKRIRELDTTLDYVVDAIYQKLFAIRDYYNWCKKQGFTVEMLTSEGYMRACLTTLTEFTTNAILEEKIKPYQDTYEKETKNV